MTHAEFAAIAADIRNTAKTEGRFAAIQKIEEHATNALRAAGLTVDWAAPLEVGNGIATNCPTEAAADALIAWGTANGYHVTERCFDDDCDWMVTLEK